MGPSDREAIALEVDEMRKEILSIANAQDSNEVFFRYKTNTIPFIVNNYNGLIEYKGDRELRVVISESNIMETTLDGGSLLKM